MNSDSPAKSKRGGQMDLGNLHSGLQIHAKNKPNEIAVTYYDETRTYKDLYERVNGLANSLIQLGVRKGDHVALYMKNRLEMMEILYAISAAGAVAVPINYMVEGKDLQQLINDSDACIAFVEAEKLDAYEEVIMNFVTLQKATTIIVGKRSLAPAYLQYEHLVLSGSKESPDVMVQSDDVAAILYSSGTTSLPKGIIITQGNEIYRAFRTAIEWNINYDDTVLITVPIYHSVGHLYIFYLGLLGCKIVITRDFDAEQTLKIIQDEQVTLSFFVPTQYILMLQVSSFEQYNLSSLRLLVSAAAPLAEATKQQILGKFKCDLTEFLGTTEAGPETSLRPKDVLRKTASVGKQADFVELRLVDEDGNDVAVDQEGEFAVRGAALFSGYFKRPEETDKTMLPGGWHRTGDMGKLDNEGFYYLLDRKKDMIISGGVNIYPKDIEEILYTHSAVLEAAVIGVPDGKWGEKVKAFVVLKDEEEADRLQLIEYCNERLAKYQHIKELEIISSLPRNPSGKILKRELRSN
jgi:acyl-CoA synthetase (AMP-forming)/AMP-acid ligase II